MPRFLFLVVLAMNGASGGSSCLAVNIVVDEVGPMSPRNQAAWWSPIVSRSGSDYVSYLSPNSPQDDVFVARRDENGVWEEADTGVNAGYDVGHTQTSLAVDGQGRLHVAYGMHNHPMRLVVSNLSESVSGGFSVPEPSSLAVFAGGAYTYPNMTTAPNGDVYMIVRDQRSSYANQQGRLFRFDNVGRTWGELPPFAGQTGTTVYPDQVLADASGDLHILWEWAAGGAQASRHYGSYARFDPDTNAYYRADGAPYAAGPISIATADIYQGLEGSERFAPNVHGVQSAKLALENDNRPLIAYGYSTTGTDSGYQHRFARWNGAEWERSTITQGPFDIEKPWIAYSDGILRYYGAVGASDPLATGFEDLFVRTSANLGENWSDPVAVTQGLNIQRPVGVTVGAVDRLYLPSIGTATLHAADVTWDAPLPEPAPDFPYFNTFSSQGLERQSSGFALNAEKGRLTFESSSAVRVDTATQAVGDIGESDFVLSSRLVVNSVAGSGNVATIGFGAFGSSESLLSGNGESFYLADWSVSPHSLAGRLRILAMGDSSDFTSMEGDSDGIVMDGASVAPGESYQLRLDGVRSGSSLELTLTLLDADGNPIGSPATAVDASPLSGNHFGFRNRIAGEDHAISVGFDDLALHAPLLLPGDYNDDSAVDAADYSLWRDQLGSEDTLPNDDSPGVSPSDYARWRSNYGRSLSDPAATSSVPEPGAWLLVTAGGLPLLFCRQSAPA